MRSSVIDALDLILCYGDTCYLPGISKIQTDFKAETSAVI